MFGSFSGRGRLRMDGATSRSDRDGIPARVSGVMDDEACRREQDEALRFPPEVVYLLP